MTKLEVSELVSITNQPVGDTNRLKMEAAYGKKYRGVQTESRTFKK